MYRENTFEATKNRHDTPSFNFSKILQKRKEFYTQLADKSGKSATKMSYNNDNFLQNLNDEFLVSEITKGEPTYHNQILCDNLRKNNEFIFRNTSYNYYSEKNSSSTTDPYNRSKSNNDKSKINIWVGENDIKVVNTQPNIYTSGRIAARVRPLYNSVERMFVPMASTGLARYNNLLLKSASSKKPATSNGLPHIDNKKFSTNSFVHNKEASNRKARGYQTGVTSMSPLNDREHLQPAERKQISENKSMIGREPTIIQKHKVQFHKAPFSTMNSFKEPDNRYLYIIPEGSDVTLVELKWVKINLTEYVEALLPKDDIFSHNPQIQRLGPYEKLQIAKPSKEMQKQVFRVILGKLEKIAIKHKKVDDSGRENGFSYLFTVDGKRISSIFDISKINKVLVAGREKYRLENIKGFNNKEQSIVNENKEKEVKSTIKQACAKWFVQNQIDIDYNFRDVSCSK